MTEHQKTIVRSLMIAIFKSVQDLGGISETELFRYMKNKGCSRTQFSNMIRALIDTKALTIERNILTADLTVGRELKLI